jgi:hypothetical protein
LLSNGLGYDIYDEAEKHYYDPGDDYPLKYIAALRGLSLAAGGAMNEDDEQMEKLGADVPPDDGIFSSEESFEP